MDEVIADVPKAKPKSKRLFWFLGILIFLIIVFSGYIAYSKYGEVISEKLFGKQADSKSTEEVVKDSTKKNTDASEDSKVEKVVDEGVTWQTPAKLGDLGLYAKNTSFEGLAEYYQTLYYKVGTTETGGEIIVAVSDPGMSNYDLHRFIKRDNKYHLIVQNSSKAELQSYYVNTDLSEDTSTVFESLLPDKTITKGETTLLYQFEEGVESASGYSAGTKIDDTKWGDLMMEQGADAGNSGGVVKVSRYYIKLNDGTRAYYLPKPSFLKDDKTFNATFTNSAKTSLTFEKMKTSGCGGGAGSFPLITQASAMAGKVEIAKTAKGSKLYSFTDPTNSLIKFAYEVYTAGSTEGVKTINEFSDNYGMIIWIDDYSNAVIYSNATYVPMAECGKPVVYLYPKTETKVSVKVGANVTKSEPEYGSGWSALAKPNGDLLVDGKVYDYLFWEGIGLGLYPTIKEGIVVERGKVAETITANLSQIGLNSKEIADFNEFWLPKLPNSKYVRLTWFLNAEMDKLAPLKVSPKPDSVIRVFLDFQGSDQPINISKQVLPHYERNGFTVVEWGGLLRGK